MVTIWLEKDNESLLLTAHCKTKRWTQATSQAAFSSLIINRRQHTRSVPGMYKAF